MSYKQFTEKGTVSEPKVCSIMIDHDRATCRTLKTSFPSISDRSSSFEERLTESMRELTFCCVERLQVFTGHVPHNRLHNAMTGFA